MSSGSSWLVSAVEPTRSAEDHGDLAALNGGRLWAWRIRLRVGSRPRGVLPQRQEIFGDDQAKAPTSRVLLTQTWRNVQINIVSREDLGIFFKANIS